MSRLSRGASEGLFPDLAARSAQFVSEATPPEHVTPGLATGEGAGGHGRAARCVEDLVFRYAHRTSVS